MRKPAAKTWGFLALRLGVNGHEPSHLGYWPQFTIVALHRAVHLARTNPNARVLLTTFSETLANALRDRLRILISSEPRIGERVEVYSIDALGERLHRLNIGAPSFASEAQIVALTEEAARTVQESRFSPSFMLTEWNQVVDAWQLDTWEGYRDVPRLGRRRRLRPTATAKRSGRSSSRCAQVFETETSSPAHRCLVSSRPGSVRRRGPRSNSTSWTRRRTSASPSFAFSQLWELSGPMVCSSPGI